MDLTCFQHPQEICVPVEEADIHMIKNMKHKKYNYGLEVCDELQGCLRGAWAVQPGGIREGREA